MTTTDTIPAPANTFADDAARRKLADPDRIRILAANLKHLSLDEALHDPRTAGLGRTLLTLGIVLEACAERIEIAESMVER